MGGSRLSVVGLHSAKDRVKKEKERKKCMT